jgi:hypothetical protein
MYGDRAVAWTDSSNRWQNQPKDQSVWLIRGFLFDVLPELTDGFAMIDRIHSL